MSDEGYDDDDFDNYEEDFDADDDYEVLPKAMLGTSMAAEQPAPLSPAVRPSSRGGLMGAGGVGQSFMPPRVVDIPPTPPLTDAQWKVARQKLSKALKKWPKLELQIVVLDELLTIGSLTEYDLFNMGRGMYAGKKVGATQTNDDAKEEECQTVEIDTQTYASQAPEDRTAMSDVEVQASSVSASASSAPSRQQPAAEAVRSTNPISRITATDPGMELKLSSFMNWAGPIMLAALGISPNSRTITLQPDPHGGKGLSGGIVPMSYPALLSQRPVNSVAFVSTAGEPLLLVAYGPVGAELGGEELLKDHTLATKGCMCVWDISAPATPRAVLISEGTPSCCGFASAPASNVVFAGMEEGGLCLWDLEEPEFKHPMEQVGSQAVCCRRPSYTTECKPDAEHGAPIVAVVAVPQGSRITPCYLYSLTSWGDVSIWNVDVMSKAEAAALDLDLGMRQGSCVRLLKVAGSVPLGKSALRSFTVAEDAGMMVMQASSLQVLPSNHRHFLVAADSGRVLKGSWVGLAAPPKEYLAHDHTSVATLLGSGRIKQPTCVTSLHISALVPWAFLAGHDDGTVTLHGLAMSTAALVWPGVGVGGVRSVRWSPTRPCTFFVLDAMCTLSCFDLTKSRSGPVFTQSFMTTDAKQPGVSSLATCVEVGNVSQASDGAETLPGFVVGYDDGRVDFLAFAPTYVTSVSGEKQVLVEIVGAEPVATTSAAATQAGKQ